MEGIIITLAGFDSRVVATRRRGRAAGDSLLPSYCPIDLHSSGREPDVKGLLPPAIAAAAPLLVPTDVGRKSMRKDGRA
jgi:hypothetical protein